MRGSDLRDFVQEQTGKEPVRVGLVLGSGLGGLADRVEGLAIDYADLPGFPHAGVSGHNPKLVIGTLEGVRVAIFGGRAHYYESGKPDVMRAPLELLQSLGAESLLLTNSAGSLREDLPPGNIMALSDHISLFGQNPLIGEKTDKRFVNMTEPYDPDIRAALHAAAEAEDVTCGDGVYAWCTGPSFESPAEIRMLKTLGADAVGMSTVPEAILARFLGLKVVAVSVITNMGAGMAAENISHEQTKEMAPIGAAKLEKVIRRWLRDMA
ncbi:purine-nucleoside phosphorylase [Paracoccaceae bacterium GXU_MW_L88]